MTGFGRYNLLCKLGEGGMGVLHLARQKTLKRFCAIKLVHRRLSEDEEISSRFLREAQAAALLAHPSLVSVFDCDRHDGQYFIAMEFIEGMTLAEVVAQRGPLPPSLALYWMHQAAMGLEYVHGRRVVHRDIKPHNMMVDPEGLLKIVDMGLAKHRAEGDLSLTLSGAMMGSPHYMSPEQIEDSKTVDHRTDLYSLGIVLYELIVGKAPFAHKTSSSALMMAHLKDPIPSVADACPEGAAGLDELISRLTAKDRDARIASASELIKKIQTLLELHPLDQASNQVWSGLDFASRKVENILRKRGIDIRRVDDDCPPGSPPEPRANRPAGPPPAADPEPPPIAPKAPLRLARHPSAGAPSPSPPRSAWRISPRLVIALLLAGAGTYFYVTRPEDAKRIGEGAASLWAGAKEMVARRSLDPLLQPVAFDPVGKTEAEITAEWGAPTGSIAMGEETQLSYEAGTVTMQNGKAIAFKSAPRSSPDSDSVSQASNQAAARREEQQLLLRRIEESLAEKRRELDQILAERSYDRFGRPSRSRSKEQNDRIAHVREQIRQLDSEARAQRERLSRF